MKRGLGVPLGERAPAAEVTPPTATAGRHVWVLDAGRCPGVLLEWRRAADGGWEGRAAYVVEAPRGPRLVVSWLPAALLEPVPV